jgi:phage/plasmid-like protein (TIGR03299 family)
MSHELTTNTATQQVEFAYLQSDGVAWHGLGQPMQDSASIDEWKHAAGMEWKIQRSKVRYAVSRDPNEALLEIPDQHVLFRNDTRAALGVVSERYKIVQPGEVLEFFRDIAKVGGLELSAAGTLYGGKRFWATAKIGEASPTSVKDKIGGYLLLSTSADGSQRTEARRTTIRVVCRNTLTMAMADSSAWVKISHRTDFDPAQVKKFMGLNEAAWDAFRHQVVRLANVPVTQEQAELMTAGLLGGGDKVYATAGFNKILDLFGGDGKGADMDGVRGTGWGYLNAVTEYVDHWTRARTDQNRFVAAQWGLGAALKEDALRTVTALITP